MHNHDAAIEIANSTLESDLNEADTRHRVIDRVLHEVLAWPKSRVRCEEFIRPGYADYVLERESGKRELLIEAKKQGHFFSLPADLVGTKRSAYVKVRTLLTDAAVLGKHRFNQSAQSHLRIANAYFRESSNCVAFHESTRVF